MESSAFLVAERTSPDIQLSSLSGNQTCVPLLYMFSAIAVARTRSTSQPRLCSQYAQFPNQGYATWLVVIFI